MKPGTWYWAVAWLTLAGCTHPPEPMTLVARPTAPLEAVAAVHLPNAYRIHPRIMSGGQPDGEAGFRELQQLGVRTVISVDGAKPQVELAAQYGLRYVHLPHGYDGIPEQRAIELAKAVSELPGPIYIHCHHGQHRSPAAAAVACVGAGLVPRQQGLALLDAAGTSPNYQGLYQSAQQARCFDDTLLRALSVEFPESVEPAPLAAAMVDLERTYERLKTLQRTHWVTPANHPDLDAAHEALQLREHFTEMLRTEQVLQRPTRFRQWLGECQTAAEQLEVALRDWSDRRAPLPAMVTDSFMQITARCSDCHRQYRDIPLSEQPVSPR